MDHQWITIIKIVGSLFYETNSNTWMAHEQTLYGQYVYIKFFLSHLMAFSTCKF